MVAMTCQHYRVAERRRPETYETVIGCMDCEAVLQTITDEALANYDGVLMSGHLLNWSPRARMAVVSNRQLSSPLVGQESWEAGEDAYESCLADIDGLLP